MNYKKIASELTDEQKISAYVELIETANRICENTVCTDCKLRNMCPASAGNTNDIEKTATDIIAWSKDNPEPVWTYKDEFFKRCPDAAKDNNGYPHISRADLFGGTPYKITEQFYEQWDEPYPEEPK